MKKVIIGLISFFLIASLYSCRQEKKINLSTSFIQVELDDSIKDLIDVYLDAHPKLLSKEFGLLVGVVDNNKNDYILVLLNFYLEDDGHIENNDSRHATKFRDFRVYVYDDTNIISKVKSQNILIKYKMSNDEIIPSTYGGNMWELHFKDNTLNEMFFIPENFKKKISEIFINK